MCIGNIYYYYYYYFFFVDIIKRVTLVCKIDENPKTLGNGSRLWLKENTHGYPVNALKQQQNGPWPPELNRNCFLAHKKTLPGNKEIKERRRKIKYFAIKEGP